MTHKQIESTLRDFIDHTVLHGQGSDITSTTPLFDLGILDSFALLTVVFFIEQRFGITLHLEALTGDDFRDIRNIANLVHSHPLLNP